MTLPWPPAYTMAEANTKCEVNIMGGRGAYAQRIKAGGRRNAQLSGGGGGTASDQKSGSVNLSGGGDAPNLSTYDVVSFSYKSESSGSMTIKDADGKTHKSLEVSSGSTRTTYIFKDFVLKFEGLKIGGYPGQNEADAIAYAGVARGNRQYFTRLLTENRAMNLTVGGAPRKVQVIAAERAIPVKPTAAEYKSVEAKIRTVLENKGGRNPIKDVSLSYGNPRADGKGHNVNIVRLANGKVSFKIYDYAYQDIGRKGNASRPSRRVSRISF